MSEHLGTPYVNGSNISYSLSRITHHHHAIQLCLHRPEYSHFIIISFIADQLQFVTASSIRIQVLWHWFSITSILTNYLTSSSETSITFTTSTRCDAVTKCRMLHVNLSPDVYVARAASSSQGLHVLVLYRTVPRLKVNKQISRTSKCINSVQVKLTKMNRDKMDTN
jgi:hypothetical protein